MRRVIFFKEPCVNYIDINRVCSAMRTVITADLLRYINYGYPRISADE